MRILDQQRYWSFIKAYFICYVSLVGLYVVIDAFANVDEFSKRADGAVEIFRIMGRYYLVHQATFFDQLCGVIGMMAAIFTVTWMQRNNEQIAMLAAGVSTQRAIRPVLIMSVIVNLFASANQELVIPKYGEELARRHDDDGTEKVTSIASRYDSIGLLLHGSSADRATKTIMPIHVVVPWQLFGTMWTIKGQQATYVPDDHPTAPLKGGWLIREATIDPPLNEETLEKSGELVHRVDNLDGFPLAVTLGPKGAIARTDAARPTDSALVPHSEIAYLASLPPFPAVFNPLALRLETLLDAKREPVPSSADVDSNHIFQPHSEITYLASIPPLPGAFNPLALQLETTLDQKSNMGRATYFLKSSLTFQAMTRGVHWYNFAPTAELLQSLTDPATDGFERKDIAKFLHVRILRPMLSLALVGMSLPLVLGGYGRNMFINLGFALGNSAIFYGSLIFTAYLADFGVIPLEMVAWAPMILFGIIATLRWGQIRT